MTSRLSNRPLECEPSRAAMLDWVPIAQPLARRRDGRACAFYEQLFRWRPERIDAEPARTPRSTLATR